MTTVMTEANSTCTCPRCGRALPHEASEPRFCVWCGHPVRQACPYEGGESPTWVPLAAPGGQSPEACASGHLLLHCPSCRRVYRIDEEACRTPGCQNARGALVEGTPSFATQDGPVDGSRRVSVPGRFLGDDQRTVEQCLPFPVSQVASRYGLLVMATPNGLCVARWSRQGWQLEPPLSQTPAAPQGPLVLGAGHAFMPTVAGVEAIRLDSLRAVIPFPGAVRYQTVDGPRWYRITADPMGQAEVRIVHCRSWHEQVIPLPVAEASVTALAASGQVVMATSDPAAHLLLVDPASGNVTNVGEHMQHYMWIRLAANGRAIYALGRQPDGTELALAAFTSDGAPAAPRSIPGTWEPDFAVDDRQVYLSAPDGLHIVPLHRFHRRDTEHVEFTAGQRARPGLLVLRDAGGAECALVKRQADIYQNLYLVHLASRSVTPIDDGGRHADWVPTGWPQVCVAGDQLVTVTPCGAETRVRTHRLAGGY